MFRKSSKTLCKYEFIPTPKIGVGMKRIEVDRMARKTVSTTIAGEVDERLSELAKLYGMNKSSLLNRLLYRTFSKPDAIKNLIAVRLSERENVIKRSYRIDEELLESMSQYPDLSIGTIIEKAAAQWMALNDEERRDFLFFWEV